MESKADDRRCKRNDGQKWRCRETASSGKSYCEKHLAQLKSKTKNKNKNIQRERSNGDSDTDNPVKNCEKHLAQLKNKSRNKKIQRERSDGDSGSDNPVKNCKLKEVKYPIFFFLNYFLCCSKLSEK